MAGQNFQLTDTMPDIFQYVTVTLGADTVDQTGILDAYIMYCDKTTVVDAAFLSFTEKDGSNDATFLLHYVPSGLQETAGTTPVGPEGSGTSLCSAPVTSGTTDAASVEFPISTLTNIVPAGNRIALKITGTSNIEGVNVTIRISTRLR